MIEKLTTVFLQKYKHKPTHVFFCPGRINLIGEHIDYNGGKVLPAAISLGTWVACSFNEEQVIHLDAINFEESYSGKILDAKQGEEWFNYPMGVFHFINQIKPINKGINMVFVGNLPTGSGLSSSASIEVLTTYTLSKLYDIPLSLKEITLLSKKVENEFIGVNCGIMDQYAVAYGKEKHCMLLDCAAVTHEYNEVDFGDYNLVIINTNKPRSLVTSKYNERYEECMEALLMMQQQHQIIHLCDLKADDYRIWKSQYEFSTFWPRGLHVVEENERVQDAMICLQNKDVKGLGKLLFKSHDSLKNLYEVSGIELDTIVDFCKTYNHCIGARMTGGGFGGCAIALVHERHFEDFAVEMMMYYKSKIGYSCGVYKAAISDGVRELLIET
jgi:galactokinase